MYNIHGGCECHNWQDILYLSLSLSHVLVTVKGTVGNVINCILGFVFICILGFVFICILGFVFICILGFISSPLRPYFTSFCKSDGHLGINKVVNNKMAVLFCLLQTCSIFTHIFQKWRQLGLCVIACQLTKASFVCLQCFVCLSCIVCSSCFVCWFILFCLLIFFPFHFYQMWQPLGLACRLTTK